MECTVGAAFAATGRAAMAAGEAAMASTNSSIEKRRSITRDPYSVAGKAAVSFWLLSIGQNLAVPFVEPA
jgi:hypothetical protein